MPRILTLQEHRKAIAFLAVLLLVTLVFTVVIGFPFLRPLAYALILATVFHPLQVYLRKRIHRQGWAAFLSTAFIFFLIVVPIAFVLNVAAVQAANIAHGLIERSASEGGFVPFLTDLLEKPLELLGRFIDISRFHPEQQIAENLKTYGVRVLPTAASLVGNFFSVVANLVIALITCFFLLRDGEQIVNKTVDMLPVSENHANQLVQTLKNTIVANVQGVFAVGATQGIATGIALAILGVGPATLLGILAAFCSIIPVVGAGLVWGPAAIYLIATDHAIKGIVLLVIGGGVISMLDNIIRPLIVSSRVQANPLVLMLAMLGGAKAFGFLGLFVGPVVIALLIAVGTMLREEVASVRKEQAQEASASPLD